jgi:hypothetical protein
MMEALLDVVKVIPKPGYLLHLVFENGEERVFDMSPYMDKKPFVALKGSPRFAMAAVECGTVVWPGGIDIAPETLYDRSRAVETQAFCSDAEVRSPKELGGVRS